MNKYINKNENLLGPSGSGIVTQLTFDPSQSSWEAASRAQWYI